MNRIPVMRPRLPTIDKFETYLAQIDATRVYSNFGPLNSLLSARLAKHFNVEPDNILLVSNGTLALQGAIATSSLPNTTWSVPSWTFIATVQAILSAGRGFKFEDVAVGNWQIPPSETRGTDGVLPVVPFGGVVNLFDWASESVRRPVVIDAASCFDSCGDLSLVNKFNIAVMVSLHATKLVSTGEGGVVIGPKAWIADIKQWTNFGFFGDRIARRIGTNAKLSEFNCAVGLASMDLWPEVRNHWVDRCDYVARIFAGSDINFQPDFGKGRATSTAVAITRDPAEKFRVFQKLSEGGVETRDWWGAGVHTMPSIKDVCGLYDSLPVTESLASRTIGLPLFLDISDIELEYIAELIL